jgi:hypothetical protein
MMTPAVFHSTPLESMELWTHRSHCRVQRTDSTRCNSHALVCQLRLQPARHPYTSKCSTQANAKFVLNMFSHSSVVKSVNRQCMLQFIRAEGDHPSVRAQCSIICMTAPNAEKVSGTVNIRHTYLKPVLYPESKQTWPRTPGPGQGDIANVTLGTAGKTLPRVAPRLNETNVKRLPCRTLMITLLTQNLSKADAELLIARAQKRRSREIRCYYMQVMDGAATKHATGAAPEVS